MNIVVIAHYQNDGSPYVSFVHDQAKEYVKLGHKVIVIAPVVWLKKYKKNIPNSDEKDGVKIYYPKIFSFSNYGKYNLNIFFAHYKIKKIIKNILKEGFWIDIIHAHTIGLDGAVAVKIKKEYNIPVVITTHGTDTIYEATHGKLEWIQNICKDADEVVAVSTKLSNILGDSNITPRVILNGFNSNKKKRAKNYSETTILQVGSLIPRKKVNITIKAFNEVLKEYPNAKLKIIGSGPERENLKKECQRLGIEKKVFFCGQLDHEKVIDNMAASSIFVMPSINEGLGIVYLEAMGAGCITIGTRGEGITDIIECGENGFLIEKDDFLSLAEIIKYTLDKDNALKINQMRKCAINSTQFLTWEINAKQYLRLFSEILEERKKK